MRMFKDLNAPKERKDAKTIQPKGEQHAHISIFYPRLHSSPDRWNIYIVSWARALVTVEDSRYNVFITQEYSQRTWRMLQRMSSISVSSIWQMPSAINTDDADDVKEK